MAQTSTSIRALGYGIQIRIFAHSFKFRAWVCIFVAAFAVIFALVLLFSARGELSAAFYPVIKLENSVFPVGMFALLCVFPFILEVKESIKWKYCLAKM